MSRVKTIKVEDWSPELRAAAPLDQATPLEQGLMRMFAHQPEVAMAIANLNGAIKATRTIGERLAELMRLRIAFHNQCRSCMAIRYRDARQDKLDETLVCSLDRPQDSKNLTAAEKLAVRYADLMATDHLAIGDAIYDKLREYFNEAQIVELGVHAAICVGFGRLSATWHMVEELPEVFQGDPDETLTPWNNAFIEVGPLGKAPVGPQPA